jgi:hypothetical protein
MWNVVVLKIKKAPDAGFSLKTTMGSCASPNVHKDPGTDPLVCCSQESDVRACPMLKVSQFASIVA